MRSLRRTYTAHFVPQDGCSATIGRRPFRRNVSRPTDRGRPDSRRTSQAIGYLPGYCSIHYPMMTLDGTSVWLQTIRDHFPAKEVWNSFIGRCPGNALPIDTVAFCPTICLLSRSGVVKFIYSF